MSHCPSCDNNIKDAVPRIRELGIYNTLRQEDGVLSRSLIWLRTVEVLYLVPCALRMVPEDPCVCILTKFLWQRGHYSKLLRMLSWRGLVTSAYTYHPNTRIQTYFRDELIPFSHPDV